MTFLKKCKLLILADILLFVILTIGEIALLRADDLSDLEALTEAIYFEARGEPILGQIAVGMVIMNRVASDRYPDTVAGVVHQGTQFSYYSDGQLEIYDDVKAYLQAHDIAKKLLNGELTVIIDAMHYYNPDLASPRWAKKMKIEAIIGNHVFLIEKF